MGCLGTVEGLSRGDIRGWKICTMHAALSLCCNSDHRAHASDLHNFLEIEKGEHDNMAHDSYMQCQAYSVGTHSDSITVFKIRDIALNRQKDSASDRQTYRQAGRQAQACRQAGKQAGRQTDTVVAIGLTCQVLSKLQWLSM